MIDNDVERYFANTFIVKNRRERLLYELNTPGKRYDGLSRFCHNAKDLLDPSRIIMEGENIERDHAFYEFSRDHDELCYVISPDLYEDGEYLFLDDALDIATIGLDAMIIIGSTFAVVFDEPMKGGRDKFLLSE
ncbi:MAG: hypothetical protein IKE27_11840 [Oscillospiraceae bacterium]|nr:hypothetical protein [Oscillospiraceae bacterium]